MKIIIKNDCDFIDDVLSMRYVGAVIEQGKISKGTYGESYCFMTTFSYEDKTIAVSADLLKSGTHSFRVSEYNKKG